MGLTKKYFQEKFFRPKKPRHIFSATLTLCTAQRLAPPSRTRESQVRTPRPASYIRTSGSKEKVLPTYRPYLPTGLPTYLPDYLPNPGPSRRALRLQEARASGEDQAQEGRRGAVGQPRGRDTPGPWHNEKEKLGGSARSPTSRDFFDYSHTQYQHIYIASLQLG